MVEAHTVLALLLSSYGFEPVSTGSCFLAQMTTLNPVVKKSWAPENKVKVKVTQLCLTLCNPMEYTVHGIVQNTGVDSLLQGIFPTQGLNPGLLHCRQLSQQENKSELEEVARARLACLISLKGFFLNYLCN